MNHVLKYTYFMIPHHAYHPILIQIPVIPAFENSIILVV